MLLSDPKTAAFIAENFVPAWESVRPVPKVTIDFGEGRTLERTLTGNTILSVCLPDGRVVDALPGVYTPAAFLQQMRETLQLVKSLEGLAPAAADEAILAWHRQRVSTAIQQETRRITLSKAIVESPLLKALEVRALGGVEVLPSGAPEPTEQPVNGARPRVDPKVLLARLSRRLDDVSKRPATVTQLRAAAGETAAPSPEELGRKAVELDSKTNVALVRPAVHLLFATYQRAPDARACRDDVFNKLLHIPLDDPYMGLAQALVPGTPLGKTAR